MFINIVIGLIFCSICDAVSCPKLSCNITSGDICQIDTNNSRKILNVGGERVCTTVSYLNASILWICDNTTETLRAFTCPTTCCSTFNESCCLPNPIDIYNCTKFGTFSMICINGTGSVNFREVSLLICLLIFYCLQIK